MASFDTVRPRRTLPMCLTAFEWNKDTGTFSYLIEATAHDLHAFVIQVNNRSYGDSRIRAPYRKDFMRDVVRVKGGISDYYVIGTLNINSLRQYQSAHPPKEKVYLSLGQSDLLNLRLGHSRHAVLTAQFATHWDARKLDSRLRGNDVKRKDKLVRRWAQSQT